ncbi:hypothetical protein AVEN_265043-1 [Araneus ventricosus]|uniref:RNA-directed DNA polymerase n=1 Tax=Araneus ventricosus TaxID=182803 RepID=A0A4Y2QJC5_ARAVE|nr:hypothetical protein AVEN_265043-1 [Araneus ventricosus]
MPNTRSLTRIMDGKFEKLLAMIAEMKAGCGQEEMKAGEEEMKAGQEEMRSRQEKLEQEIQKAQLEDPTIKRILEKKLNSADRPSRQQIVPESPATKRYWALWDSLHLKDGVLYRKWESDDGSFCRWQLILPKSRIPEVLRETHESASGGHFGVMKTLSKTRERFYWDRLPADATFKNGVENATLAESERSLKQELKVVCSALMLASIRKNCFG